MKKWGRIIALGAVLVVLVVAYLLLKGGLKPGSPASPSPSASTTPNPDAVRIFDFTEDEVFKIVFRYDTGDVVLTKKDTQVKSQTKNEDGSLSVTTSTVKAWVANDFKVNSTVGDNIAYAAGVNRTTRLIDPDPADLSIYGLDKPIVVTLYSESGKEASLRVGNKTPTGDAYYVLIDGDKTVYTLSSYTAEKFTVGKLDLVSKELYHMEGMVDDNITELSLYRNGEKVFDSYVIDPAVPGKWQMTYPIEIAADYVDLDKILIALASLRVSEIVDYKPSDLKQYGLDNPKYKFVYTADVVQYTLIVGSLKDSKYYAMMEGDEAVFTVDSESLSIANLPVLDLIELLIYVPSIYDTASLVIEIDGRTDVLEMDVSMKPEEKADDVYKFNGRLIETEELQALFRRYYQGAIALMGDKLELDAQPQGEPFARLTYTAKTGIVQERKTTIELIPTPDGYGYYIMKNRKYTGLVMGKRQLDKEDMGIRSSYRNFMDALNAAE